MSDLTVDPTAATKAANQLAPAADLVAESATGILQLACAQDTSKWGTESGPAGFRTRYSDALMDAYSDVKALEQQLTSYVAAVHSAVNAFQTTDSDAAATQKHIDSRLQQQEYEDAPPSPGPIIPHAE